MKRKTVKVRWTPKLERDLKRLYNLDIRREIEKIVHDQTGGRVIEFHLRNGGRSADFVVELPNGDRLEGGRYDSSNILGQHLS